eukprot:2545501-Pleurochrysis_carterae.AAC.4
MLMLVLMLMLMITVIMTISTTISGSRRARDSTKNAESPILAAKELGRLPVPTCAAAAACTHVRAAAALILNNREADDRVRYRYPLSFSHPTASRSERAACTGRVLGSRA